MEKWINADAVNAALDRIREETWLHDIPTTTAPESIERHDAIQQIMLVIDKERKLLNDAAADVAQVRHGRWETEIITDAYGLKHACYACSVCGVANDDDEFDFCPNCGAKMDKEGE